MMCVSSISIVPIGTHMSVRSMVAMMMSTTMSMVLLIIAEVVLVYRMLRGPFPYHVGGHSTLRLPQLLTDGRLFFHSAASAAHAACSKWRLEGGNMRLSSHVISQNKQRLRPRHAKRPSLALCNRSHTPRRSLLPDTW